MPSRAIASCSVGRPTASATEPPETHDSGLRLAHVIPGKSADPRKHQLSRFPVSWVHRVRPGGQDAERVQQRAKLGILVGPAIADHTCICPARPDRGHLATKARYGYQ